MIAIFLFYNQGRGKAYRYTFSKITAHCNLITYDGDHWIMWEFGTGGITYRVIKVNSSLALIRNIKRIPELTRMVVVDVITRVIIPWKMFMPRTCNEFSRYITGINIGFTVNPRHFYTKLLTYADKGNYTILHWWRRPDVEQRQ